MTHATTVTSASCLLYKNVAQKSVTSLSVLGEFFVCGSYGRYVQSRETKTEVKERNGGREGGLNKRTPKQNGCRPPAPPHKGALTGAWIQSFHPCSQTGQMCLHTCLFILRKPLQREKRTHPPEIDLSLLIRQNLGQCYASEHWE